MASLPCFEDDIHSDVSTDDLVRVLVVGQVPVFPTPSRTDTDRSTGSRANKRTSTQNAINAPAKHPAIQEFDTCASIVQMQAKLKEVLRKYGRTALVFHTTLFAATLSGAYGAIRYGVDIEKYLHKVPFVDLTRLDPQAGTFALAYVSTLATGPARGVITIGATPILARWLARYGKQLTKSSAAALKKRA